MVFALDMIIKEKVTIKAQFSNTRQCMEREKNVLLDRGFSVAEGVVMFENNSNTGYSMQKQLLQNLGRKRNIACGMGLR